MNYKPSPEVEKLIKRHMATGRFASENELLAEALRALAEQDQHEQSVAALRQSVADEKAGRIRPVEEAVKELKRETAKLCRDA